MDPDEKADIREVSKIQEEEILEISRAKNVERMLHTGEMEQQERGSVEQEIEQAHEFIVEQRQKTLEAVTGQSAEKMVGEFSDVDKEDIAEKVVKDFETLWIIT